MTHRRRCSRACLRFIAVGLALPIADAAAQDKVEVVVDLRGVTGAVAENVLATLKLNRAAERGPMPIGEARRLHRRALDDITEALEPFGYFTPKVSGSLERTADRLVAHYTVDQGPPVTVRQVTVRLTGPAAERPEFLRAAAGFPLREGEIFFQPAYEAGKALLLTVASDSGYLDAKFDTNTARVDRDAKTVDLVVVFNTGPRFKFGPVTFEQDIVDEGFLRKVIPFKPGDPWRNDRLLQLETTIAEYPYFARVEVIPDRANAKDLEVPIRVVTARRRSMSYELTVGYGTDVGPRIGIGGQFRRLNPRGHHANAQLQLAQRDQRIEIAYVIPAVWHNVGDLSFFGGYRRFDPTTSSSRITSVGTRVARTRIGWRETISLAYHAETFVIGGDSGSANLMIAGGAWERTKADNRMFPTRGVHGELEARVNPGSLVGQGFIRLRTSAKMVFGLSPGFRLLTRGEIGWLSTKNFNALPPTLRFFAGGDHSVRGFRYLSLGPRDSTGTVIGGQGLMVGSVEADWRFMPAFGLAVFTDIGNAQAKLGSGHLEQSIGAGVRYIAPIGVFRLDFAFPISDAGGPLRIHLSLGPDL